MIFFFFCPKTLRLKNAMKKLFTVWMLLGISSVALFSAEEKTYSLVRSADEVVAGKYLIAAKSDEGVWYALGYQMTNYRSAVEIAVSEDGVVTTEVATDAGEQKLPYEIRIDALTSAYYLVDELGSAPYLYLGKGESDVNLRLQPERNTTN